jgi:hypothetical protein
MDRASSSALPHPSENHDLVKPGVVPLLQRCLKHVAGAARLPAAGGTGCNVQRTPGVDDPLATAKRSVAPGLRTRVDDDPERAESVPGRA